ncbi:MAG: DUF1854 domain-containing protein [Eubacteriales bacterium]
MNETETLSFANDPLLILTPQELCFTREESGYLTLVYGTERYEKVTLTRLIPFEDEEKYLSVSYNNAEDEWREIGVIDDLSRLPAAQAEIVREYLAFKYYIPEIIKIHRITDNRMGYLFLEAQTSAGEKKIAVNDWWHNFRLLQNKMLTVTDADGNRYRIRDVDRLDKASMKHLQLFI